MFLFVVLRLPAALTCSPRWSGHLTLGIHSWSRDKVARTVTSQPKPPRGFKNTSFSDVNGHLTILPPELCFVLFILLWERKQPQLEPIKKAGNMVVNTIHWFRKGLRLHDNPSLRDSVQGADTLRCIYILDPWFAGSSNVGINRWR